MEASRWKVCEHGAVGHNDGPCCAVCDLETKLQASEAARAEVVLEMGRKYAKLLAVVEQERDQAVVARSELERRVQELENEEQAAEMTLMTWRHAARELAEATQERDQARSDAEDEREARHKAETLLEYERNASTAAVRQRDMATHDE